ncbi:MAG TPA: sulfatase [Actinomycetota bacterium]|nr:sulfatase [Actinomycetota bacterium]
MKRRRLLAMFCVALSALASGVAGRAAGDELPGDRIDRPNILIILTDDQRARGTLEVMPATKRWFVDRGINFTQAFATTPLCCPSRATIMTGRYAHNHSVTNNYRGRKLDPKLTVQRYLSYAGYTTAIVGKYFNLWPTELAPPYFDRYSVFRQGGYHNVIFNQDGQAVDVGQYSTDYISDQALRYLEGFESDDDQPWFMIVAPFAPHRPAHPAPEFEFASVPEWHRNPAENERDLGDKPGFVKDARTGLAKTEIVRAKQLQSLMSVDVMVDELETTLDVLDEDADTLAVFVSDNGYMWRDHGLLDKRLAYTASIKIPLLMSWPGRMAEGAIDDRLVGTVDIAPTLLEAAGISPDLDKPMDGRSLMRAWERETLLFEFWSDIPRFPDWSSLRTKDYQYIEYYPRGEETVEFLEYYDLRSDRWQLDNLLADGRPSNDPDTKSLARTLRFYKDCQGLTCP